MKSENFEKAQKILPKAKEKIEHYNERAPVMLELIGLATDYDANCDKLIRDAGIVIDEVEKAVKSYGAAASGARKAAEEGRGYDDASLVQRQADLSKKQEELDKRENVLNSLIGAQESREINDKVAELRRGLEGYKGPDGAAVQEVEQYITNACEAIKGKSYSTASVQLEHASSAFSRMKSVEESLTEALHPAEPPIEAPKPAKPIAVQPAKTAEEQEAALRYTPNKIMKALVKADIIKILTDRKIAESKAAEPAIPKIIRYEGDALKAIFGTDDVDPEHLYTELIIDRGLNLDKDRNDIVKYPNGVFVEKARVKKKRKGDWIKHNYETVTALEAAEGGWADYVLRGMIKDHNMSVAQPPAGAQPEAQAEHAPIEQAPPAGKKLFYSTRKKELAEAVERVARKKGLDAEKAEAPKKEGQALPDFGLYVTPAKGMEDPKWNEIAGLAKATEKGKGLEPKEKKALESLPDNAEAKQILKLLEDSDEIKKIPVFFTNYDMRGVSAGVTKYLKDEAKKIISGEKTDTADSLLGDGVTKDDEILEKYKAKEDKIAETLENAENSGLNVRDARISYDSAIRLHEKGFTKEALGMLEKTEKKLGETGVDLKAEAEEPAKPPDEAGTVYKFNNATEEKAAILLQQMEDARKEGADEEQLDFADGAYVGATEWAKDGRSDMADEKLDDAFEYLEQARRMKELEDNGEILSDKDLVDEKLLDEEEESEEKESVAIEKKEKKPHIAKIRCPKCKLVMDVRSQKRPLELRCTDCNAKLLLKE